MVYKSQANAISTIPFQFDEDGNLLISITNLSNLGTVTSVSVTTANGVSGSVATATTTPAITLTLGAITPTSIVASGAVSGSNLSGTNTGDQTTVSGNAGTATALQNARTIGGVSFNGTGNITVASATGGFTVSGGDLAVGANNITCTGSLGATGSRLTKGWFTDLQVTNSIAGSVTGTAATVTTAAQTAITSLGTLTDLTISGGTGSATGKPSIILINNFTAVANTSTGETDLITYTLPASTLVTTGQMITHKFSGVFANNVNAKTLKLYFGTTTVFSQSMPVSTAGAYYGEINIRRTGSNAQSYVYQLTRTATGGATAMTVVVGTCTETEASTIVMKLTGTGGATSDINQNFEAIYSANA